MTQSALYLLDTNTVSYMVTGRSQAARIRYETLSAAEVAICSLTEGEIRFGMQKQAVSPRRRLHLESFLESVRSVPWDSSAAHVYGNLRANLSAAGLTLGPLDLLIAAHAVALGAVLVSHDRAFARLAPLLSVEDWATDVK